MPCGALATLFALAFAPATAVQDREAEAALELARGDEHVAKGRYAEAVRAFRRVAEDFPETAVAQAAAARAHPNAMLGWSDVVRHGPSGNRVDVVLMGDGYVLKHLDMFDDLAEFIPTRFEKQPTFREYYAYFNFVRAVVVSAENGVDGFGREYDTALGAFTGSTYAGHVGVSGERVHAMLDRVPEHDGLAIVFVKNGVLGTGGYGVATIGGMSTLITLHEWGHAFANLGDEYATKIRDDATAMTRVNVSVTDDPERVPWRHWLEARVPGIGVYEGAGAQVRDAWRPTASGCLMNEGEFFCPVCREAVVLRIYTLVDPIEDCSPPAPDTEAGLILRWDPLEFRVRVMQPAEHDIEVRWWLVPEDRLVDARTSELPEREDWPERTRTSTGEVFGDRRDRGRLPNIAEKPLLVSRHGDRDGVHRLVLKPGEVDPGRYRLICRARDTTEIPGEKWPWVLRDPHGLLESERAWWIWVPGGR